MGALRIAAGIGAGVAAVAGGLALFSGFHARRAERQVPADGGFVEVDGARLHYIDVGEGPAIVMIHGLYGQLRNFSYGLVERLSTDFRVIALDRPGSGYSTVPPGERSLVAQARLIGRFIDAIGVKRPLVVGHSLGGALSLALALERPDLVGGLALVCPLTQPLTGVPRAFRPLHIRSEFRRRLTAWTLAVPLGRLGQEKARYVIFHPEAVPADFAIRGGGALTLRPGAFHTASSEVSLGSRELVGMAARYPALDLPVGILFGERDRILSPELHGGVTAAAIPGAELELVPGGHMIPLTAPDVTAAWIRRQAARAAPR